MFLTLDDFRPKASSFDLTESHNVVRILAGFMMLPHAASKFAAGGLNPGTVAFFGYGASLDDTQAFGFNSMQRVSDGFFLKLAYQIRR